MKKCKKCQKELDEGKCEKGRNVCTHCRNIQKGHIKPDTPPNTPAISSNTPDTPLLGRITPFDDLKQLFFYTEALGEKIGKIKNDPFMNFSEQMKAYNTLIVMTILDWKN